MSPARTPIDAAKKYIAERESKRVSGIEIPEHYLFDREPANNCTLHFGGIRTVNNFDLALLKDEKEAIGVMPIEKKTATRMKRLKVGEAVVLTTKGIIMKKTRGKGR